jgi:hypothetical protein
MSKTNLQKAKELLEKVNLLEFPTGDHSLPHQGRVGVNVKLHNTYVDMEELINKLCKTEEEREIFTDSWFEYKYNDYLMFAWDVAQELFKTKGELLWNPKSEFVRKNPHLFPIYEIGMWDAFQIVTGDIYQEGRSGGYLVFEVTINLSTIDYLAYDLTARIEEEDTSELEDYIFRYEELAKDLAKIDKIIAFVKEQAKLVGDGFGSFIEEEMKSELDSYR